MWYYFIIINAQGIIFHLLLRSLNLSALYTICLHTLVTMRLFQHTTHNQRAFIVTCYRSRSLIESGKGFVTLYATPNPYLLNKICLKQRLRVMLHFCPFHVTPNPFLLDKISLNKYQEFLVCYACYHTQSFSFIGMKYV